MNSNELEGILAFTKQAENLKNTLRYAFTTSGRQESAAEHSWRLCLLIMVCAHRFPHLDREKLFKLAIIHDLAEALCGDTPAIEQEKHALKAEVERSSLMQLITPLPEPVRQEILDLWEEYEEGGSAEAQCVKAFDKLETLIQHNQGCNPPDMDYTFNLTYGVKDTDKNETAQLLRQLIDPETKKLCES